jgi:exopolyphosphatase/pppGpp-phosphohydrolase
MALPGIQPQRADIIAHGMAILLCCMNELNIPQMIVSESGNLEGYLKKTYL